MSATSYFLEDDMKEQHYNKHVIVKLFLRQVREREKKETLICFEPLASRILIVQRNKTWCSQNTKPTKNRPIFGNL